MHPFLASTKVKIFGGVLILLTASVQWAFLMYYGNAPLEETVADSFFSVLWLSCFGYFLWYMLDVSRSLLLDVLLTFVVIGFWLFITYASLYLCHFKDQAIYSFFIYSLPFRVIAGIMTWVILLQWYRLCRITENNEVALVQETQNSPTLAEQTQEITDHVAVKSGTRIHIIRLEELIYLQAEGDYVLLFSPNGQYLKEQTMKYFETHLPSNRFVRIHRSCIINIEQILRVELYGKETYHVLLKNGTCLRASSAGYKLLKERLAL